MSSKLREALNQLLGLIDNEILVFNKTLEPSDISQAQYHIDKAVEAYEEPLRNCDVGNADEQYARFKKWCENEFYKRPINALTGEPCKSCPCYSVSANGVDGCNYLRWAQMQYENEGEA